MNAPRPSLTLFSPLPPARNGIADYAALLMQGLAAHYDVATQKTAEATEPAMRRLHQLGNNPQHGFVWHALRRWPGVVTLHDPGLLWLRQQMGEPAEALVAGLAPPDGGAFARLAARRGRQLRQGEPIARADHLLFDQASAVLAVSRAVVVHSRFAAARLRAFHGEAATRHVAVIPHLLPPVRPMSRAEARQRLGLPQQGFVLVSAGFAHPAKRFDWLIAAMDLAAESATPFRYLHAGAEDPALPLSAMLAERPRLRDHARVTGWLTEEALDLHIAACDALACLHFPSQGESSGVLARGLAMGVACLVADTAGYAELSRAAVLHIPVVQAVPALAAALRGLAADPALAWRLGEAGRRFAMAEMALAAVAERYREVIEASLDRPLAPSPAPPPGPLLTLPAQARAAEVAAALAGRHGACRLLLTTADLPALAALTLESPALLPPWAMLRGLRVLELPGQPGLLLDLLLP
jgi:glycosyltransferase involved in cell wall biosynthesis